MHGLQHGETSRCDTIRPNQEFRYNDVSMEQGRLKYKHINNK